MIEEKSKRSTLALSSIIMFFVPWILFAVLLWILTFLLDLGTFGVDLISYYTAVIALCPVAGLLFGVLAMRRDMGNEWPLKPPKKLTLIGLTLNIINSFALVFSKGLIMK